MWKTVVLTALLALFLFATVQVLYEHSYLGFFLMAGANSATRLMMWDLVIALSLASFWMVSDARGRQRTFIPFLAITLLFGVAGPLLYLITRGRGKRFQWLAGMVLLLGLGTVSATAWPLADLRTNHFRGASIENARKGRELLRRVAERHGLEAWQRHVTMEVVATDTWAGDSPWWPEPVQDLRTEALLGTFTSRVELLSGPREGEVWGLQAWSAYRKTRMADPAVFLDKPAPEIEFYLPTLQYFNELPFRLLKAGVILDAGDSRHRGRDYHRIFVSWGSAKPTIEVDQYLLWIDRQTLLVEMARYTLREAIQLASGPMATVYRSVAAGTIHYDDYREVEGVLVPFEQTIALPPPELTEYPLTAGFFHRLVAKRVTFDTVPADALIPAPWRGLPADSKE